MSKGNSNLFSNTRGARKSLIDEANVSAAISNPQSITMITRDSSGKIKWLEENSQGVCINNTHQRDCIFEDLREDLRTDDIPEVIFYAINQGTIVGTQGERGKRIVYEVIYKGRKYHIAVQTSKCGKIVNYNFQKCNRKMDQVKKVKFLLEYNTYCLWLLDENDEIIDNCNPPEWAADRPLTDALMAISNLFDKFFIDTKKRFIYKGCPDKKTKARLQTLISKAEKMVISRNHDKYEIINCITVFDKQVFDVV